MTETEPREDPAQCAQVVAAWGRRAMILTDKGIRTQARFSGKKQRAVCGDRVRAHPLTGESEWLVVEILPRDSELARTESRGRREVLAANISQLVVVAAPVPDADWFIVDRYLCAAVQIGISAIVVFNKTDLVTSLPAELEEFRSIDYRVIDTSCNTGDGIGALATALRDELSVFVGQSGVGKSSLINAMLGDQRQRIAELSRASREGQHTTVASELIALPGGGSIIDSPGVRDYAPSITDERSVADCYLDIAAIARQCRFDDCRHRAEPDCAVKFAVDDGSLSRRRFDSYRRLLNLTKKLNAKRY